VIRTALLEKLDKATDRAATMAIRRNMPLPVTKKLVMVGNVSIEKNKKGLYNVLSMTKELLYEDIAVFDVAVIVAQNYCVGDTRRIKQVLQLEERFAKYHTDMTFYLHAMRGSKKRGDLEKFAILEDKFNTAESCAKEIRDKISFYKRVK
jgi:hypothetical protein